MAPGYVVRPVRAHEWREIKALRLAALCDDAAPVAFLESYGDAAGRPDEFWQERARRSSVDAGREAGVRQFIAAADDGAWVGTATVLVEHAGDEDVTGTVLDQPGGHVVGVYLAPEHRGRGVLPNLLDAASAWARERGLPRARLHVHVDNARARRAYEKAGFRSTGVQIIAVNGPELEMATLL